MLDYPLYIAFQNIYVDPHGLHALYEVSIFELCKSENCS